MVPLPPLLASFATRCFPLPNYLIHPSSLYLRVSEAGNKMVGEKDGAVGGKVAGGGGQRGMSGRERRVEGVVQWREVGE